MDFGYSTQINTRSCSCSCFCSCFAPAPDPTPISDHALIPTPYSCLHYKSASAPTPALAPAPTFDPALIPAPTLVPFPVSTHRFASAIAPVPALPAPPKSPTHAPRPHVDTKCLAVAFFYTQMPISKNYSKTFLKHRHKDDWR